MAAHASPNPAAFIRHTPIGLGAHELDGSKADNDHGFVEAGFGGRQLNLQSREERRECLESGLADIDEELEHHLPPKP